MTVSIPSEEIMDSTTEEVSDTSERGGEEIWAQSSVMEVSTRRTEEGSSKGESLDKGGAIQLGWCNGLFLPWTW